MNVAISERMLAELRQMGVDNAVYIPNWANGWLIQPVKHANNPLRKEWGLEDKFVVGYSGNFGRAHGFDAIVEAAMLLGKIPDIHFLFIGEGANLDQVEADLARKQLSHVSFQPYQSTELLRYSLGAIDLHLISLLLHKQRKQ